MDVDNEGGYAMHVQGHMVHGKSLLSAQFCCESKTVLKNKSLKRKKKEEIKHIQKTIEDQLKPI